MRPLPRRRFLQAAAMAPLGATLAACAPAVAPSSPAAAPPAQPAAPAPAFAPPQAATKTELQQLLEAVRKEATDGPLFLSMTQPNQDATYRALFDAFNQRFGLSVQYEWQAHQNDYYLKVAAEAQAGRRTPDLITGSLDNMVALDEAGLLASYDWVSVLGSELPTIGEIVERAMAPLRGKSLPHFDVIHVIVYNSSLIASNRVPRTLEQVTDPQWDRRFGMNSTGSPLDTLAVELGSERVLEIARKIKANRPVFKRGAPSVVAAISAGEVPLGFGYTTGAEIERSKGAPVEWLSLQDYLPVLQQNIAVLKSAQRPNLARLFAAWAVTEGMAIQERLEFMGRATARGTPIWERLNQLSPQAKIVEVKSTDDVKVRSAMTDEITKLFIQ